MQSKMIKLAEKDSEKHVFATPETKKYIRKAKANAKAMEAYSQNVRNRLKTGMDYAAINRLQNIVDEQLYSINDVNVVKFREIDARRNKKAKIDILKLVTETYRLDKNRSFEERAN